MSVTQEPLTITASGFNSLPLATVATMGGFPNTAASNRPAQWDHAHWYGVPAANNITARAGGGQALATLLGAAINRVTAVATAADSIALPVSVAGLWVVLINSGANALQLFGSGTDTINGVASSTGVSVASSKTFMAFCPVAGVWFGGALT